MRATQDMLGLRRFPHSLCVLAAAVGVAVHLQHGSRPADNGGCSGQRGDAGSPVQAKRLPLREGVPATDRHATRASKSVRRCGR